MTRLGGRIASAWTLSCIFISLGYGGSAFIATTGTKHSTHVAGHQRRPWARRKDPASIEFMLNVLDRRGGNCAGRHLCAAGWLESLSGSSASNSAKDDKLLEAEALEEMAVVHNEEGMKCTILGGGSFGLAMACVVARRGVHATLLVRNRDHAKSINEKRRHPQYLSDLTLPANIVATTEAADALREPSFVIHAVPVQYSRRYLRKIAKLLPPAVPVLCTSKGIEKKSLELMCEILPSILGEERGYAFLSGPSFAREIAEGLATAVVVASDDRRLAYEFSAILSSTSFRVFTSQDVVGVEVGGAVKNVIALAAGMCEGLDLGMNAMTALVTRGCYEMQRIALSMGGRSSTIMGLSGVGDTFGTCFGPLSRNRNLGVRLGRGEKLQDILDSVTEVAEGVETAFALERLIKRNHKSYRLDLKFPIVFGVVEILRGDSTPREGLESLMLMPLRPEFLGEKESPRLLRSNHMSEGPSHDPAGSSNLFSRSAGFPASLEVEDTA